MQKVGGGMSHCLTEICAWDIVHFPNFCSSSPSRTRSNPRFTRAKTLCLIRQLLPQVNCPFCGVEFHLKTRLQQHIKLMHTERGVKNWKCGYCAHASALRGNCRKHQKNEHKGMKEWIVDLRKEKPTIVNQQLETAFPQMRKLVY